MVESSSHEVQLHREMRNVWELFSEGERSTKAKLKGCSFLSLSTVSITIRLFRHLFLIALCYEQWQQNVQEGSDCTSWKSETPQELPC